MLSAVINSFAAATITINGKTSTISDDDFWAIFGAVMSAILIPMIIMIVLQIVAMWKIFTKCGVAGWKSIIPIYNYVVMLQITGINPLWLLVLLLPFAGSIFGVLLMIVMNIRLAKGFDKSTGFTVGLILLSFIFELILAFDASTWDANKIDYESFSFLNGKRPAGAKASSANTASSSASSKKEDSWVEGKGK